MSFQILNALLYSHINLTTSVSSLHTDQKLHLILSGATLNQSKLRVINWRGDPSPDQKRRLAPKTTEEHRSDHFQARNRTLVTLGTKRCCIVKI